MEYDPVPIIQTWTAMEELVVVPGWQTIGVSNFNIALIRDLLAQCSIRPGVIAGGIASLFDAIQIASILPTRIDCIHRVFSIGGPFLCADWDGQRIRLGIGDTIDSRDRFSSL